MKLTKQESKLVKTYDDKQYVDWEQAFLDRCETKEDIQLYKNMKQLAKKLYAKSDDTNSKISVEV